LGDPEYIETEFDKLQSHIFKHYNEYGGSTVEWRKSAEDAPLKLAAYAILAHRAIWDERDRLLLDKEGL